MHYPGTPKCRPSPKEVPDVNDTSIVICPNCGSAVPTGGFCGACGAPFAPRPTVLKAPAAAQSGPPAWPGANGNQLPEAPQIAAPQLPFTSPQIPYQGGPASTSPYPSPRPVLPVQPSPRPPIARKSLISAVAVIVALGVGGFLVFGSGEHHTIPGSLSLSASATDSLSPGESCSGDNGYSDIEGGTEVVLTNQSGTTLATASLETGTFDGEACVFDFTLHNVPKAKFYRIAAGNSIRGGPEYSYAEMQANHWSFDLTLGD